MWAFADDLQVRLTVIIAFLTVTERCTADIPCRTSSWRKGGRQEDKASVIGRRAMASVFKPRF